MAKTKRYAVCILRYCDEGKVKVVGEHHSLCAAGRTLGSYISGKRRLAGLKWAFVRDRYCPGENTPWSTATISRAQILRVCAR